MKIARAHAFESVGSKRFSYPALNDLDRRLAQYLPDRGSFVEVGANDGYSQSNTYYLERFGGWDGVLIEPLPDLYRVCRSHRRAQCFNTALVAPGGPSTVEIVDRGLMAVAPSLVRPAEREARSGMHHRRLTVPATTLSSVIDLSGLHEVTFLSVDVEGAEIPLLRGLDLDRHCPKLMLIETNTPADVTDVVSGHLRLVTKLSHHDYLYGQA